MEERLDDGARTQRRRRARLARRLGVRRARLLRRARDRSRAGASNRGVDSAVEAPGGRVSRRPRPRLDPSLASRRWRPPARTPRWTRSASVVQAQGQGARRGRRRCGGRSASSRASRGTPRALPASPLSLAGRVVDAAPALSSLSRAAAAPHHRPPAPADNPPPLPPPPSSSPPPLSSPRGLQTTRGGDRLSPAPRRRGLRVRRRRGRLGDLRRASRERVVEAPRVRPRSGCASPRRRSAPRCTCRVNADVASSLLSAICACTRRRC